MAVTLLGMFMSVLDNMIIGIALPTITAYFHAEIALSQWTMTAYLIAMTATLLIFGKLSEYTGKERMFLAGMGLFTLASLGCALAPTLLVLIVLRTVQGVGAAMAVSIVMALIIGLFPAGEHGKAMGTLGATIAVASLTGPVLGGFLIELAGWQSVFLINIPFGLLLLVLGLWSMDLTKPASGQIPMDWGGAAGLVVGISGLMFFLGSLSGGASQSAALMASGLAAVAGFVLFYQSVTTHPNPLLDLSVVSVRAFILPVASMVLFFTVVFMVNVSVPFYLEEAVGYSPSQVGLVFLVIPAVLAIGAPLTGRLYDRYPWKHYMPVGLGIAALALFAFAGAIRAGETGLLVPVLAIFAAGYALFQSPNNTEIMRSLPPAQSGIASSLSGTGRHFGMALGVAITAVIVSVQSSLAGAGGAGAGAGAGPEMFVSVSATNMAIAAAVCLAAAMPLILRRTPDTNTKQRKNTLNKCHWHCKNPQLWQNKIPQLQNLCFVSKLRFSQ